MGKDTINKTDNWLQGEKKEIPDRVMEPAFAYQYEQVGDKTLEDYIALPEGTRVELIDGIFYDMASTSFGHQGISGEIRAVFSAYIKKNHGQCKTVQDVDVQLFGDNKTVVRPDVFVVCDRKKITLNRLVGAPDLIVEVVSPGNWKIDVYVKKKKYMEAGVREYWLVFPNDRKVQVYCFAESQTPETTEPKEYTFADKVPVGIWGGKCEVDFTEVYEEVRFLYEG
ncbi:MAG: Uma2 family endonuclease [Lachnospiraceae bacterium]|nr:Uma2 family endonuclease [Lachnospiraceae bacterium]